MTTPAGRKEASFAALCGASPVDASSGKQIRHRLNRGGDRQANSALWTIAMTRLAHDPRTRAYLARRTAQGKTKKEIIRCLKRYIARGSTRPSAAPNSQAGHQHHMSNKIVRLSFGGPASITFGELDGRTSRRAQRLLAWCEQAGFEAELSASIKTVLWAKVAFICAQAGMTAAGRLPIGEIRTVDVAWADLAAWLQRYARWPRRMAAACRRPPRTAAWPWRRP